MIELNFDSLYEGLLASNSTALGSVAITSDYMYYELICYQTHAEQIITDNVLTVGWTDDFQEYFKGFVSPWRHFVQAVDILAFR